KRFCPFKRTQPSQEVALLDGAMNRKPLPFGNSLQPQEIDIRSEIAGSRIKKRIDLLAELVGAERVSRRSVEGSVVYKEGATRVVAKATGDALDERFKG